MERRDVIKLMIASAVAPAFIVQGLMKVKPIRQATKMETGFYAGFRWYESDQVSFLGENSEPRPHILVENPNSFKTMSALYINHDPHKIIRGFHVSSIGS